MPRVSDGMFGEWMILLGFVDGDYSFRSATWRGFLHALIIGGCIHILQIDTILTEIRAQADISQWSNTLLSIANILYYIIESVSLPLTSILALCVLLLQLDANLFPILVTATWGRFVAYLSLFIVILMYGVYVLGLAMQYPFVWLFVLIFELTVFAFGILPYWKVVIWLGDTLADNNNPVANAMGGGILAFYAGLFLLPYLPS